MPYIPHTNNDIESMLSAIGISSIDELFSEIPPHLKNAQLNNIPNGLTEMEMTRFMQAKALKNKNGLCFLGAGAYEHYIPAAIWDIATRGEWMTAYTPYQAEASQGTLQLIYEYQTMMTRLTGMDVSNASLYEGASALAEAILMAVRFNKNRKLHCILIPSTLHPHYRQTIRSIINHNNIEFIEIPFDSENGTISLTSLQNITIQEITALVIPQPNFFGLLEDVDSLTDWAHAQNALVIAVVNPISLALLKEPGKWGKKGSDIVCGEGQPLGIPLSSGGPYFGFLCCKEKLLRQMPGRIVGRTVDTEGKEGFVLTLQAREQHIRRSKATSNICTNQGLLVTAATIYMSLLGPKGLRHVAMLCHANTKQFIEKIRQIKGVDIIFNMPFFHETVLRLPQPINLVLEKLSLAGIQGGYNLSEHYPSLGNAMLVCLTETKTEEDIAYYKKQLEIAL